MTKKNSEWLRMTSNDLERLRMTEKDLKWLKMTENNPYLLTLNYDGFPPKATFVFQRRSKWKKCINENAKISE